MATLAHLAYNPLPDGSRRCGSAQSDLVPGQDTVYIKFKHDTVSELAGYQLAQVLRVPVPRHAGFWCSEPVFVARQLTRPGRIGIALEHLVDVRRIDRQQAARLAPAATARFLALCMFNRHEWGEPIMANGRVMFIDLEYTLPAVSPELIGAADVDTGYLDRCLRDYVNAGVAAVNEVLEEAAGLGLLERVARLARTQCAVPSTKFAFDAHPSDAIVRAHVRSGFRHRCRDIGTLTRGVTIR